MNSAVLPVLGLPTRATVAVVVRGDGAGLRRRLKSLLCEFIVFCLIGLSTTLKALITVLLTLWLGGKHTLKTKTYQ